MTNAIERARKRETRLKKEVRADKLVKAIWSVVKCVLIGTAMLVFATLLTGTLYQNPERALGILVVVATWALGMFLFAKAFHKE